MDLKSVSNSFKVSHERLEEAFDKQHPCEGYFAHSKYGWGSLKAAEQTWIFVLFEYIDSLEKRIDELEKKGIFI